MYNLAEATLSIVLIIAELEAVNLKFHTDNFSKGFVVFFPPEDITFEKDNNPENHPM